VNLSSTTVSTEGTHPFEHIDVRADPNGSPCPDEFRDRVMVDVIHDGNWIPEKFTSPDPDHVLHPTNLESSFVSERDWGAECVASSLASALHLPRYHRVNTARALLDFGRFPGTSRSGADHMSRFAITHPFSEQLDHKQVQDLLENHYDVISRGMDEVMEDKLLKIAIHTYDPRKPGRSRRPAVSILTRFHGLTDAPGNPLRLFDPACPAEIVEMTTDPILRSRLLLHLEEAAIYAAENYPYTLPEGSVEVRAMVWFFFRHVRQKFIAAHPELDQDEAADAVWKMLMDTNLRSADCYALRGFLHMYRRPAREDEALFLEARDYYTHVATFIAEHRETLVRDWLQSTVRPSSLILEVRKDLVFEYEGGRPVRPRFKDAQYLARVFASAIRHYLTEDRPAHEEALAAQDSRFR
jgi:hypothetical protein